MKCILCDEPLDVVPIYNNGKDDDYPPNFPICNNAMCGRYGLLTIVFKSTVKDESSEHKEV